MEQLIEVKQSKLKKMSSDRIKKHLIKVGYDEDELEQMSRSELMNTLAHEWLKEIKVENISSSSSSEEEGAVGGAEAEVKVTSPMSMEMFLQWMMMEKQERKEEMKRMEEERRREKEEQRKEQKEEKKERERREREEIEKRQRDADVELRRSELEVQQAQFKQQLDEIRQNT